MTDHLPQPHGGALCSLLVEPTVAELLKDASRDYPSHTLSRRQLCDLELLMNGAFSPLRGFMTAAEYDAVTESMRLPNGLLWPIPVTLDVPDALGEKLKPGSRLALRDQEGFMLAVLEIDEVWRPDKTREALRVYGTDSEEHPGVRYLLQDVFPTYVGGRVLGIELPSHHEFESLWHSPAELRQLFRKLGWRQVLAFQTSRPMHRLQRELVVDAARRIGAHVLLHPTVGVTKPGDLQYYARVRCYEAIRRHFPHGLVELSLLPLAMRMAGPRETLWHAIIHKNCGCSHFLVGPQHASPPGEKGAQFFGAYESQELVARHADELGISMLSVEEHRYAPAAGRYLPMSVLEEQGAESLDYPEEALRLDLALGRPVPEWFSYPDVLGQLRRAFPPRSRLGFTLFFTGLSGSGKSTLAKIIYAKLIEEGSRPVTLLDGDIVRQHLSSELGFSKTHRDLNIRRIGFVASEITKNGGVAICAPIAPYRETRRAVRRMIEEHGAFIEVHVATPLEVCEARDRKGLYAKARQGLIKEFTGISDPYEVPERAEIDIDTSNLSPMEAAQEIYLHLLKEGYI
jgi:sulfate adenylyltransferase